MPSAEREATSSGYVGSTGQACSGSGTSAGIGVPSWRRPSPASGSIQLPEIRWTEPGLGEWDVRSLVGHTSRALLTVETYLASPADVVEVGSTAEYYRATRAAAAGPEVAARGVAAGEALGTDPAAAVAEIAARVSERCFHSLAAPVLRVSGLDIPYPPPILEHTHLPGVDRILDTIARLQWDDEPDLTHATAGAQGVPA